MGEDVQATCKGIKSTSAWGLGDACSSPSREPHCQAHLGPTRLCVWICQATLKGQLTWDGVACVNSHLTHPRGRTLTGFAANPLLVHG